MSENDVIEALENLRDADQSREPAPHVEAHLLEQFRRRRAPRLWMRASASAAAAAAIVMVVTMYAHRPQRAPEPPAVSITPIVVPAAPPADTAVHPPRPKPVQVRRAAEVVPHEVYTDFFPLMDLAPPLERGELVRVIVPASTMRGVGMLVMASHLDDPVEADVLIGQDGLARAIRFVSYQ
ncbi:MAG TPA: hypothetical protein VIY49_01145 [Bryobacteraceae bacterium]